MDTIYNHLKEVTYLLIILIGSIITYFVAKKYVLTMVAKYIKHTDNKWDDLFFEQKVLHLLAYITPVPIIYLASFLFPAVQAPVEKILLVYVAVIFVLLAEKILNIMLIIYNSYEIAKIRPITNFIQVAKIIVYFLGFLFILSLVFNKSILAFLSGLGALTAVLMLVFKDSLLSFKAGIQLIANDMLRIGDWVELPKYGADGDVIEISLDTIKVQNWDKTITFIPTYKLMEDSFKNWRGMTETGGRRISRSILIDQHSVRFLHDEDIERYKKFYLLKEYIEEKNAELHEYNQSLNLDNSFVVNGRKMTNIGTFRIYLINYLKTHPGIRQDLTLLVRQLEPTSEGVPIQIYAFTNNTQWAVYEGIQSDIFDHILAILPQFDLRIYQKLNRIELQKELHPPQPPKQINPN